MSTRSNVSIILPTGQKQVLYRHYDGYLSENGAIVAIAARKLLEGTLPKDIDQITEWFTVQNYEGRPLYRVTDGIHGDIEHKYRIEVTANGNVCVSRGRLWSQYSNQTVQGINLH